MTTNGGFDPSTTAHNTSRRGHNPLDEKRTHPESWTHRNALWLAIALLCTALSSALTLPSTAAAATRPIPAACRPSKSNSAKQLPAVYAAQSNVDYAGGANPNARWEASGSFFPTPLRTGTGSRHPQVSFPTCYHVVTYILYEGTSGTSGAVAAHVIQNDYWVAPKTNLKQVWTPVAFTNGPPPSDGVAFDFHVTAIRPGYRESKIVPIHQNFPVHSSSLISRVWCTAQGVAEGTFQIATSIQSIIANSGIKGGKLVNILTDSERYLVKQVDTDPVVKWSSNGQAVNKYGTKILAAMRMKLESEGEDARTVGKVIVRLRYYDTETKATQSWDVTPENIASGRVLVLDAAQALGLVTGIGQAAQQISTTCWDS